MDDLPCMHLDDAESNGNIEIFPLVDMNRAARQPVFGVSDQVRHKLL